MSSKKTKVATKTNATNNQALDDLIKQARRLAEPSECGIGNSIKLANGEDEPFILLVTASFCDAQQMLIILSECREIPSPCPASSRFIAHEALIKAALQFIYAGLTAIEKGLRTYNAFGNPDFAQVDNLQPLLKKARRIEILLERIRLALRAGAL